MAIYKQVADLLNEQINKELYSAYLYVAIADHFEDRGLAGFAHWYMIQAAEEIDHAMIIRRFLVDNDHRPELEPIEKPVGFFESDMAALRAALEHEEYVTRSIHRIYSVAQDASDYLSMQMLEWFIEEQGEEETSARDMVRNLELFGGDRGGLYKLDREYAGRSRGVPDVAL